jgi:hypothetical protein
MSYMQEVEKELRAMLTAFASGDLSTDQFIRTEKARMLESYRNGIEAGKLHAHDEGVKAIEKTFSPRTEKRSGQAPFRRKYYKRMS